MRFITIIGRIILLGILFAFLGGFTGITLQNTIKMGGSGSPILGDKILWEAASGDIILWDASTDQVQWE